MDGYIRLIRFCCNVCEIVTFDCRVGVCTPSGQPLEKVKGPDGGGDEYGFGCDDVVGICDEVIGASLNIENAYMCIRMWT